MRRDESNPLRTLIRWLYLATPFLVLAVFIFWGVR